MEIKAADVKALRDRTGAGMMECKKALAETNGDAAAAEKLLKEKGLGCLFIGEGDTVTGQIPASGQILPGGSQVLAYLGEPVPEQKVSVPDFTGLNRQQAADLAGRLGLHILVTGNQEISQHVVAVQQDVQKDAAVAVGTTIRLRFSDNSARD